MRIEMRAKPGLAGERWRVVVVVVSGLAFLGSILSSRALEGSAGERKVAEARHFTVYFVDGRRAAFMTKPGQDAERELESKRQDAQERIDRMRAELLGASPGLTSAEYGQRVDALDGAIERADAELQTMEEALTHPLEVQLRTLLVQAHKRDRELLWIDPEDISPIAASIGHEDCNATAWLAAAFDGRSVAMPDRRKCQVSRIDVVALPSVLARFPPARRAASDLDALRDARQKTLDERTKALGANSRGPMKSEQPGNARRPVTVAGGDRSGPQKVEVEKRALALEAQKFQEELALEEEERMAVVRTQLASHLIEWRASSGPAGVLLLDGGSDPSAVLANFPSEIRGCDVTEFALKYIEAACSEERCPGNGVTTSVPPGGSVRSINMRPAVMKPRSERPSRRETSSLTGLYPSACPVREPDPRVPDPR